MFIIILIIIYNISVTGHDELDNSSVLIGFRWLFIRYIYSHLNS